MPENALQKTLAKDQYLNRAKSVNLKQHLDEQKKIKAGGLEGIEVRKTNKQLGKDDFLQLLITQLTHQDPTAPVKDQAFIAQMAQFSSLEQMKNMSSTLKAMSEKQSGNLVGKFIIGKDHLSGEQVSGVAQAMFYDKAGDAFFKVGGKVVRVNDITLVGKPEMFKQEYGGTANDTRKPHQNTQARHLSNPLATTDEKPGTRIPPGKQISSGELQKNLESVDLSQKPAVTQNTDIPKESAQTQLMQKKAHKAYNDNLKEGK